MNLGPDVMRSRIEEWLASKLPAARELRLDPLTKPGGAGFSAEMFFTTAHYRDGGAAVTRDLVVRRQVFGHDLLMDADLRLQWDVMDAFARNTNVPVPPLIGIEQDHTVLGAPFLVMEKVPGRVVQQMPNYNLTGWVAELPIKKRGEVWRRGIENMADIHAIDWHNGFEFLSRPELGEPGLDQYLNWIKRWYEWAAAGRSWPVLETALDYISKNRPASSMVSVLWGDPIPANTLYGDDLKVTATIDWEMASLGPGEIDLAWWLYFDQLFSEGFAVKRLEGLPDRQETIAIYEGRTGRPVQNIEYYETLSTFRMAIVAARQVDRQIALGTIPATNKAHDHNATAAYLATLIGAPVPEVGEDFKQLMDVMKKNAGH